MGLVLSLYTGTENEEINEGEAACIHACARGETYFFVGPILLGPFLNSLTHL